MIALSDQTYIFNDTVLRASSQITTDLVAQSAPNLVQGKQHDSSVILKRANLARFRPGSPHYAMTGRLGKCGKHADCLGPCAAIEVTNEDYVLALRWVPNLGEPVEYQNLPLYVSKQNWNRLRRESLSLIARLDKLARAP